MNQEKPIIMSLEQVRKIGNLTYVWTGSECHTLCRTVEELAEALKDAEEQAAPYHVYLDDSDNRMVNCFYCQAHSATRDNFPHKEDCYYGKLVHILAQLDAKEKL